MKSLLLVLVSFLFYNSSLKAQAYVLDESYKDESFLAFKLKLVQALLDRNVSEIKELVSDDIIAMKDPSFPGKKGFVHDFMKDKKATQQFCKDALKLISFGFRKGKLDDLEKERGYTKVFYAPSFHRDFDYCYGGTKYQDKALILGDNVNVRERPTSKSPAIGQVSYEILEFQSPIDDHWEPLVRENTEPHPKGKYWYAVKLKDGKIGYIIEDYVSDNYYIDLRVAKTKEGWKVVSYFMPYRC
ncbi:MAG: SH3 domain-containing protein [Aureispira sp.]|nr:SH3 domain-containing protein [Aureispira sp.]